MFKKYLSRIIPKALSKRSHPSNPSEAILYALAGWSIATKSGTQINETLALNMTAVWACVRVLSESIAQMPLILYRRKKEGKERAVNHPLYNTLHVSPNPEMTSMVYREVMMHHLATWGNSYSHIIRDGRGFVESLWPLRPDRVDIKRNDRDELVYVFNKPNGSQVEYPRMDILHIPALSFDGIVGYSPIKKMQEAIGLGVATEEFGARFFSNGARPSLVLKYPESLDQEAITRMRDAWNENFRGLENQNKLAILEGGMDVQAIGIPPEDSQFLETRKFQVNEIARAFRVPPHMIGELDRSTYNNITQQSLEFVLYSLMPWMVRIEQNITKQLLSDVEWRNYFCEHLVDGLLRGEIDTRYRAYATGRQWGWLSINDIRKLENMNPIDEGGDVYLTPMNMMDVKDIENLGNKPPMGAQNPPLKLIKSRNDIQETRQAKFEHDFITQMGFLSKSQYPLFRQAAERIVGMETIAVTRSVNKFLNSRNLTDFRMWVENFYGEMPAQIRRSFKPVHDAFQELIMDLTSKSVNVKVSRELLESFFSDYHETFARRYIASSLKQLRSAMRDVEPEKLADFIKQRMTEWAETRADKVARDELHRTMNSTIRETAKRAGVTQMKWVTQGDNCPWCNTLEGRVVDITQHFIGDGEVIYAQTDEPNETIEYDDLDLEIEHGVGCAQSKE